MFKKIRRTISFFILTAFITASVQIPSYAQSAQLGMILQLPAPGVLVHLSPEFTPAQLQGITIHPDNALQFDFLIRRGDKILNDDQKKEEYKKLVKYFLASLTIPDDDQWVNLSPYEKNRIIKDDFGKTEMGRDLLAEDYMLKQITSSLIYPEDGLGKKFWDRVYERAWKEYHTTDIPVNTFNKVWIVPDLAIVYESGNTAYILKSHLKVMLEEDYLSLQKHSAISPTQMTAGNDTHAIGSQVIREIILPELEHEVNEGKNFANLRQIFSGMVLATWYKKALKESLLGRIYADKARVKGVDQDPRANEAIYQRYLKAFKKGVFNYIKEDVDKYTNEAIPRKYFSGGYQPLKGVNNDPSKLGQPVVTVVTSANIGMLSKDILSDSALLTNLKGNGMDDMTTDFTQAKAVNPIAAPSPSAGMITWQKELKKGQRTVVVAEFGGTFRFAEETLLKNLGYDVLTASDQDELKKIMAEKGDQVDAVLTGTLNWTKTIKEVQDDYERDFRIKLPVIFTGGQADDEKVLDQENVPYMAFIKEMEINAQLKSTLDRLFTNTAQAANLWGRNFGTGTIFVERDGTAWQIVEEKEKGQFLRKFDADGRPTTEDHLLRAYQAGIPSGQTNWKWAPSPEALAILSKSRAKRLEGSVAIDRVGKTNFIHFDIGRYREEINKADQMSTDDLNRLESIIIEHFDESPKGDGPITLDYYLVKFNLIDATYEQINAALPYFLTSKDIMTASQYFFSSPSTRGLKNSSQSFKKSEREWKFIIEKSAAMTTETAVKPPVIFIVEDQTVLGGTYEMLAQSSAPPGYEVVWVQDEKDAMEKARRLKSDGRKVNLFTFDTNIGDTELGFKIYDQIKELGLIAADTRIIATTGRTGEYDTEWNQRRGDNPNFHFVPDKPNQFVNVFIKIIGSLPPSEAMTVQAPTTQEIESIKKVFEELQSQEIEASKGKITSWEYDLNMLNQIIGNLAKVKTWTDFVRAANLSGLRVGVAEYKRYPNPFLERRIIAILLLRYKEIARLRSSELGSLRAVLENSRGDNPETDEQLVDLEKEAQGSSMGLGFLFVRLMRANAITNEDFFKAFERSEKELLASNETVAAMLGVEASPPSAAMQAITLPTNSRVLTTPAVSPTGGIDLNAANMNLQIRRDGKGVPLPLAQQDMAQLIHIQGFEPEIIEIKAAVNLPILTELQQKLQPATA